MATILFLIYLVLAWNSVNYLQNRMGLAFFMNLRGFAYLLLYKLFASVLLGWLIIPIALIHKAMKR
ncbi:hypothetical protein SOV_10410 [Sporomusa ovata DSM 2662]|uniref:Uncharacterized protein n=1 Tax=Sporomusa ovata TaxID=2378 RepID=A0A0U1KXP8_9FIRM|nr:hypothetical protein SOV_1c03790 [Sporomusa ovata DSM 2662]CQR72201.1 hypothetical protein SpAn4DRAFT_5090 [Sporomusa ovata]